MASMEASNRGNGSAGAPSHPNKPSNSAFRQQRLVAWQPIMSPPHVVACLVVLAVAFVPIGISIHFANQDVTDIEFRYDDIRECSPTDNDALFTWNNTHSQGCRTVVNFTVPALMKSPVYMYYKLTNFYQNHRRFAKSRSGSQLDGSEPTDSALSDCSPFKNAGSNSGSGSRVISVNNESRQVDDFVYSPCGLVAWSMFNDSFLLYSSEPGLGGSVENPVLVCDGTAFSRTDNMNTSAQRCRKKGITWESDDDKFKTPYVSTSVWTASRAAYGLTPLTTDDDFLREGWYVDEPGHSLPVTTDQDFQVWMRTAALPSFRKLYRVIDVDLPPGSYSMVIHEYYPVDSFGGSKSFALTTLSWLGGENNFLAIAYIVVGSLSLLLAFVFFVIYKANHSRVKRAVESLSQLQ